ncbi:MFS transporter [Dickeya fangzhongdai]|uniref:MFS transporter n=1 Tax=Dickeya fangzhongdai TaxID=1778540 RepID=UPI000574F544|nr:MFS transporter [Dickeya fangzhongdai]KHN53362.1 MFS transporter [Dickeya fangzhongdai]
MSSTLSSSTLDQSQRLDDKAVQFATRAVFFITGAAMSAWAPLVPYAKSRLNINDASLGMLLLMIAIGSLTAMPLAGVLSARLGCRRVMLSAAAPLFVVLPALTQVSTLPAMAVLLFLFGAAIGLLDVTMNIQAVVVEQASKRAMLSGFHGFYSVGGIAGAGGVSGLLWLGCSPLWAIIIMVLLLLLLLLCGTHRHLLHGSGHAERSPLFVRPRGVVMTIGALCFIMFLAEGAILDWSALFLSGKRGLDSRLAGVGYAAFSIAMTLGRLNGDRLTQKLGRYVMAAGGSLCAALGLLLAIAVDNPITAITGFILVGLGASNVVPILFSAAGRQRIMPAGLAVASVSTLGYTGILTGPALLGFIAQWSSLSLALGLVALLLVVVSLSIRPLTRSSGA